MKQTWELMNCALDRNSEFSFQDISATLREIFEISLEFIINESSASLNLNFFLPKPW